MSFDADFWQGASSVLLSLGTGLQAGLALADRNNARALNDWLGSVALQRSDDGREVRDLMRDTPDLARSVSHFTCQFLGWLLLSAGAAAAAPNLWVGCLAALAAAVTGLVTWWRENQRQKTLHDSTQKEAGS